MHRITLTLAVGAFACALWACASPALATQAHFFSEAAKTVTGKEVTFKLGEGTVKCAGIKFSWELVGEATTLLVKPTYSECHAEAILKVPVTVSNSCDLTLEEPTEAGSNKYTGDIAIGPKSCTSTFEGSFGGLSCKVTSSGEQKELKGDELSDTKSVENEYEAESKLEATGIAYTAEGSGCAAAGISTGSHTNGEILTQDRLPNIISAPPARWKIAGLMGAYLGNGVKEAVKFNNQTSIEFKTLGAGAVRVTCTSMTGTGTVEGTAAGTPGKGTITGLTFGGCVQGGLANCSVSSVTSGASGTSPFNITLGLVANGGTSAYRILNPPETKFTVALMGNNCMSAGNNLIKGAIEGTYVNSTEALTLPSPRLSLTTLTYLEEECAIIGKYRIELNAGGELVAN